MAIDSKCTVSDACLQGFFATLRSLACVFSDAGGTGAIFYTVIFTERLGSSLVILAQY